MDKNTKKAPTDDACNTHGAYYALPSLVGYTKHDPRSDYNRGPAYTFAGRKINDNKNSSPGPIYAFDPKLYKTGKDGAPRFSVRGRMKEPVFFSTPGPNPDKREDFDASCRHRAPAYSFGGRNQQKASDATPGPNAYRVPYMIGPSSVQSNKRQAPSFSIKSRDKRGAMGEDLQHSPGPAAYDTVDAKHYKQKPPGYSMRPKTKMINGATDSPGPTAYKSEEVWLHKRRQPQSSFGVRHSSHVVPLIVP